MNGVDKMFEVLGYKKDEAENDYIRYKKIGYNNEFKDIVFDLEHNLLNISTENTSNYQTITTILNMQELQAINEKIKELGWLESE